MVLEIWAQETSKTTTDLKMNKNRRSIPLFISNRETISLNENRNESFNSDVIENSKLVNNEIATGFARDDVKTYNNISHLTSNGYYGYSSNIVDNSYENNCASSVSVMDVDLNNSNLQFERRKRCFAVTDDMTTPSYQKKFKYGDEYENFHQTSFDPNGTSISFNNEENKDEIHNCSQIETEMMQTNEAEILQTKYTPAEETNQFTLLKQKSFTEFNMKETQKIHKTNIKNKFDSNNSYSTCKYNEKFNYKKLKTNTENLLENLFLLTHGGSNYQMWQHYNINIDT